MPRAGPASSLCCVGKPGYEKALLPSSSSCAFGVSLFIMSAGSATNCDTRVSALPALVVAVNAPACPFVSIAPKLDRLTGLVCAEVLLLPSGIVIFSAAWRKGSLSLSGAGASVALLMPPPPINDCIAATAGLGVVSLDVRSDCLLRFASAIAAAPVSRAGERRGEKANDLSFGDVVAAAKMGSCEIGAGGRTESSRMVGRDGVMPDGEEGDLGALIS